MGGGGGGIARIDEAGGIDIWIGSDKPRPYTTLRQDFYAAKAYDARTACNKNWKEDFALKQLR